MLNGYKQCTSTHIATIHVIVTIANTVIQIASYDQCQCLEEN